MTEFNNQIAALRRRFLDRTEGDLVTLVAAVERGDFEQIRSISHRIAGIAGVFGFPELGAKARFIEDALELGAPEEIMRPLYASLLCAIRSSLAEER